jgi:hypothetical protein
MSRFNFWPRHILANIEKNLLTSCNCHDQNEFELSRLHSPLEQKVVLLCLFENQSSNQSPVSIC